MAGKYFSKKEEDFYLPGEEIKIDKKTSFSSFSCEKDPLAVCKNRLLAAVVAFAAVYLVISFRLFDLCIVPNLFDDDTHVSSMYITGTFPEKKLTIETIRKMDRI